MDDKKVKDEGSNESDKGNEAAQYENSKAARDRYRLGLRAKKTAIAVFFCLVIDCLLLHGYAFYAAIAAVICMQPSNEKSLDMGLHRFIGTCIGGTIGFVLIEFDRWVPIYENSIYLFIAPFGVLCVIYLCNVIRQASSASIGCIVFLNIVTNFDRGVGGTVPYVVNRVLDTLVGIVIAVLVNRFFYPKQSLAYFTAKNPKLSEKG